MMNNWVQRMGAVAALAATTALGGCNASGTINGEEGVPLSELDQSGTPPTELMVAGSDKVIVTESDTFTVTVEGDDEAAERVRFVRDGNLIGVTRESGDWGSDWGSSGSAVVRIGMPAPSEIVLGGSGEVEAETIASKAEAIIGGSGSMSIARVEAENLEITIGGSGSMKAAGSAKALDLTIGGSGSANLGDLTADNAEISIGGSGSVSLMSDGKVNASIGGSGSIDVTGSAECTLDSFGSGSLNCRPGKAKASAKSEEDAAAE
ncbi:MAG: head GIN domain-containing protein [Pseudomonadota bacterium]